jgi:ABC-type bacteriocin/lantibiotic exporter with double-glycine peptidase domain
MLRCAKELGLKARSYKTSWARLGSTPLPGIAVLRDGGFLFLGKVGDDKAIVQARCKPPCWAKRATIFLRRSLFLMASAAIRSHGIDTLITLIR